ncbi:hypothetical protein [Paenibacillus endoradicis]|uniref:hypothetical protein n=1 Tax=Paenibacillus endoradicis TaxID=2972487 RepID=UPI0021597C25|nr:hypothetical protein [Paenibacillus endoradicis]MCR8657459.1 hypothetical protein [Paenibacillus endoradicis]
MVFGRRLSPAPNQQGNIKERDQPNVVTKPSQRELSPVWRMQQSIGNKASSQLLQHISHTAPMTTATEGMNLQFKQLIFVLSLQAQQAGEGMIWSQFEALSVGQRQSLLLQWYGEIGDFTTAMSIMPDWKQWQEMITSVRRITLQPEEPFNEADISTLGAKEPKVEMSGAGLLFPYHETWLWLNYKGNKQGQAHLLQRLDRLSILKKQLLLHKLNGAGQLSLYQLSNNVTIEEHLKQWVDWNRIEEALHVMNGLNDRQVERQLETVQQVNNTNLSHPESGQEELEQDDDQQFSWLGFIGFDGQSEDAEQPVSMEQILQDPEKMFQLLFGIHFDNGKQPITVGNRDQLINRFLEIDHKLLPKQQEQQRMQKLKEQGYASINQLIMLLKITMIDILYQFGVTRKDKKFITILQKLELLQGKKKPTREYIATRIHSI